MATHAGWHPDPEGRFEFRYHNGAAWTRDVAIGGRRYVDLPGRGADTGSPGTSPDSQPDGTGATGTPGSPDAPSGEGPPPRAPRRATAAMVVAIAGACVAWMPVLFVLGMAAGVVAIVLGGPLAGRHQASPGRGFARAGVAVGVASLVVGVVGYWFTTRMFDAVDAYENPARHDSEITRCEVTQTADGQGQAVVAGSLHHREDGSSGSDGFTVRIEIDRADSGRTVQRATVSVDDVPPGETREFELQREVSTSDVDCSIARVDGPLPFGFDPG